MLGPCYFVADRTHDGKAIRMLCIIDEFSRESLAIPVAQKLKATDLNEAICELFVSRGIPAHMRSDDGPSSVRALFVSGSPPLAPLLSELLLDWSTDLEEIN